MTATLASILPAVGATLIATRSGIAESFKTRTGLTRFSFLDCPMCLGFWCGIGVYLMDGCRSPWELFLAGCSVSLVSHVVSTVTDALQAYFASTVRSPQDGV